MSKRMYTYVPYYKIPKNFDIYKDCILLAFPGKTSKRKKFDKLNHKENHVPYLDYYTEKEES